MMAKVPRTAAPSPVVVRDMTRTDKNITNVVYGHRPRKTRKIGINARNVELLEHSLQKQSLIKLC